MKNKLLNYLAALSIYGLLALLIVYMYPSRDSFNLNNIFKYKEIIIDGFFTTILVSVLALIFSVIFGFLLYLLTTSKVMFLQIMGSIFDDIVFGSPLVVFVGVIFYFIAVPLGMNNRLIAGIIALSLYMAPYMKNLFVGAMESIDDLQYQAMKVFGFSTFQKYRYIIFPQLLKIMLPPLVGNLTFIVKGSSLLYFISVDELYSTIDTAMANTYAVVEGYLTLFVLYLLITIPLIRATRYMERRISNGNQNKESEPLI